MAEFSGSDRTVADYLFAEVLQRPDRARSPAPAEYSILERVNGPLADRLLGHPPVGASILLQLEDAGAFVF